MGATMGCAPSAPTAAAETAAPPKVYLFAASQPSRSVQMLIDMGGIDAEIVNVNLMAGEKCKPNPMGSVPYIEDAAFGVSMGEGLAILIHLCETRPQLAQYYPTDPAVRATINYWLHWHHTGSRKSTMVFRAFFKTEDVAVHERALYEVLPMFLYMEQALARQGTKFFAGGELTIADLALITEVDQLDSMLDLIFGDGLFPLLDAWRMRVAEQPAYQSNRGLQVIKSLAPMLAPKTARLKVCVGPKVVDAIKALSASASAPDAAEVTSAADANKDGKLTPAEVGAFLARLDDEA